MPANTKPGKPKPAKPYPDYPLFAHGNGQWAKKIKGRLHYFGAWSDPQAAIDKYTEQRDDLQAGRKPRRKGGGEATIRDLANTFLTWKQGLVDSGDLSRRTFVTYHETCLKIVAHFGVHRLVADLDADDFQRFRSALARGRAPTTLEAEITRTRIVFKFAHDRGLIQTAVRYGGAFNKPSRKVLRQARADVPRAFRAADLRAILNASDDHVRTFTLLGVNCGFGPTDIGTLPRKALDLEGGWVNFPRPKTAIPRRCPLWPQTVAAILKAITPPRDALAFRTATGSPWTRGEPTNQSNITRRFRQVLEKAGLYQRGVGFYTLRRTFETIAGDSRDQVTVDAIMGHAPKTGDMGAVYRGRIDDDRLVAVTEHVRGWLFDRPADDQAGADVVPFSRIG